MMKKLAATGLFRVSSLGGVVRNEGISWKLLYDCLGFELVSQE